MGEIHHCANTDDLFIPGSDLYNPPILTVLTHLFNSLAHSPSMAEQLIAFAQRTKERPYVGSWLQDPVIENTKYI
jgi:hypothetical protein